MDGKKWQKICPKLILSLKRGSSKWNFNSNFHSMLQQCKKNLILLAKKGEEADHVALGYSNTAST